MLPQDTRRDPRVDANGDLVQLEEHDRSRWHRAQIAEGLAWLLAEMRGRIGNAHDT